MIIKRFHADIYFGNRWEKNIYMIIMMMMIKQMKHNCFTVLEANYLGQEGSLRFISRKIN